MGKYIVAGEMNKIQDLIFKSSKLREVAGGSQLLEAFCEEVVPKIVERLGGHKSDIIISKAGSFCVVFDSFDIAQKFGIYLRMAYKKVLGGKITVTDPIEFSDQKVARTEAFRALIEKKQKGDSNKSIVQMPYIAICQSCGVEIAEQYFKHDNEKRYLCEYCHGKDLALKKIKKYFHGKFISKLKKRISVITEKNVSFPTTVDLIASIHNKRCIAYLVADVNDMGLMFGKCSSFNALKTLSEELDNAIWDSLSEPTQKIMKKIEFGTDVEVYIPVIPLIVGGDDIFFVLPAEWAIDFAREFVKAFEKKMMNDVMPKVGITHKVTMTAAIVITKSKYPYYLAHEIGKKIVYYGKKRAKIERSSIVGVEQITGNELVYGDDSILFSGIEQVIFALDELDLLFEFKKKLQDLSGKKRNELLMHFYKVNEFINTPKWLKELKKWYKTFERITNRIEVPLRNDINSAYKELGAKSKQASEENCFNWRMIEDNLIHGFPTLLRLWDFIEKLEEEN